jgi:hypothetical protein
MKRIPPVDSELNNVSEFSGPASASADPADDLPSGVENSNVLLETVDDVDPPSGVGREPRFSSKRGHPRRSLQGPDFTKLNPAFFARGSGDYAAGCHLA